MESTLITEVIAWMDTPREGGFRLSVVASPDEGASRLIASHLTTGRAFSLPMTASVGELFETPAANERDAG